MNTKAYDYLNQVTTIEAYVYSLFEDDMTIVRIVPSVFFDCCIRLKELCTNYLDVVKNESWQYAFTQQISKLPSFYGELAFYIRESIDLYDQMISFLEYSDPYKESGMAYCQALFLEQYEKRSFWFRSVLDQIEESQT